MNAYRTSFQNIETMNPKRPANLDTNSVQQQYFYG